MVRAPNITHAASAGSISVDHEAGQSQHFEVVWGDIFGSRDSPTHVIVQLRVEIGLLFQGSDISFHYDE